MDKDFITTYLLEKNYWWEKGRVSEEDKGIPRKSYLQAIAEPLVYERIVCLTGIRRAGKTTLIYQIIDELLKKHNAKRIVYAKIDDLTDKIEHLKDILSVYQEITGINPKIEEVFFLFDEIHFLENWQTQINYFLEGKYKSKFIISGSSKTLLYKDASETLVGRIRFIDVFPLSFQEFLGFNGIEVQSFDFADYKAVKKSFLELTTKKEQILHYFNEYLEIGAFPEWFKVKNKLQWRRMLVDDYFSLILFKDIALVFKPKDPILLEKVAKECAQLSTNRFNFSSLAARLDSDRETIKLYLYYLKSSMLTYIAEIYSKTKRMREKREKKIFFWEEGMRKALTSDKDEGKAVENVVAWHLIKKGVSSKIFFQPFYWRNKHEVDFVYDDGKEILPVEVKYRERPDIAGILEFLEKFNSKKGIIITKDLLKEEIKMNKHIIFIPTWLFLLSF